MLSMLLDDIQTFAEPESVNVFQKSLPLQWIETVLKTTNKASIRRRNLPAELVVWLVVGMGLNSLLQMALAFALLIHPSLLSIWAI